MKTSDLEDANLLVSRAELREVVLAIRQDMLEIKNQISDLREIIRTKWWIPVAVALITMIGTSIASIAAVIILHKP